MKQKLKRLLSLGLILALITAMALSMTSCDMEREEPGDVADQAESQVQHFTFAVTFKDGSTESETYQFRGEVNLGDFLQERGVIAGDDGEFGLYVKTVKGETLDYNADGYYWSLYENSELCMTGVSGITVEDGATYELRAESAS